MINSSPQAIRIALIKEIIMENIDNDKEFSQRIFKPNRDFAKLARIKNMCEYEDLCYEADRDYEKFWGDLAKQKIDWFKPFDKVLNSDNAPFYKWFEGGKLNVSYQCIDRHLKEKKNKVAIIFEGEMGDYKVITYRKLYTEVNKTANLLKNHFDIKKGDRVVLYMPMIPEVAIMMLACARIGAIHSVVFGGFSPEALRDRIIDAEAKLVVTADGAFRKGKPYMLKPAVDKALENNACPSVQRVLIVTRNDQDIEYVRGRDFSYNMKVGYLSQSLWIPKILYFCFIQVVVQANQKVCNIAQRATFYMHSLLWNGYLISKILITTGVLLMWVGLLGIHILFMDL